MATVLPHMVHDDALAVWTEGNGKEAPGKAVGGSERPAEAVSCGGIPDPGRFHISDQHGPAVGSEDGHLERCCLQQWLANRPRCARVPEAHSATLVPQDKLVVRTDGENCSRLRSRDQQGALGLD